jgi:tricorn protease
MKKRLVALAAVVVLVAGHLSAQQARTAAQTRSVTDESPAPLQTPALSRTQIAFVLGGYVWIVNREGGEARRLTGRPGAEARPRFSPDGSQLAFTKSVNGNTDVYVQAVAGGEMRRLTYHPKADFVAGWTPDGSRVLFESERVSDAFARLYTIPARGGFPAELPLPTAWDGSFSPDGARIAYTALPDATATWRNYRGGQAAPLRIARLADSRTESLPHRDSNDRAPMWVGDTIYFISDRDGTANLHAYDTRTKRVEQLTRFEKFDIKAASAASDAIVFAQGGALHLLDLQSRRVRKIPFSINAEFPETAPRRAPLARWIRSFNLSPTGAHAYFGARGEVWRVNLQTNEAEDLTGTPEAAERFPAPSPDGNLLAYFSDESGEYQLHIRALKDRQTIRRVNIEAGPSFYEEPVWSPDSKRLAFSDKRLALWTVDLETGAARRVDSSGFAGQGSFRPAWSADGRRLAYVKAMPNRLRAIFLHSLETGRKAQVSDARTDAFEPAFDREGKHLYFLASATSGARRVFGMSSFPFQALVTSTVQAVVLQRNGRSPLLPAGEEAGGSATGEARAIDLEGIAQRVVRLPIPARNYEGLAAGADGALFLSETSFANAIGGEAPPQRTLYAFNLRDRKAEKFIEDLGGFTLSADGSRILYQKGGDWFVVPANAKPAGEAGKIDLGRAEISVEPVREWRQMYAEAWRVMRDYFYDARHHGQDLNRLRDVYAAYLPNITTRGDLNYLFREMFSHLSVSHVQVGGGDSAQPQGRPANVGLLGADYTVEQGRYRIARILRGDNSQPLLSAPLAQPGVDVREGDYLIAVDGQEIGAGENLYKYFQDKAGRPTRIKVSAQSSGENARTHTVVPLPGENTLRDFNWVEANRRRVEELSGGRLAYIYLADTGRNGYNAFNRDFYAQQDRQGVIIDERFNSGGAPADYVIEHLRRAPLSYYMFREGADFPFPQNVIQGPRVMVVNEYAGSGGDTLPWMFRQAKLGKIVGKRTWGGGVGGYVDIPELLDGGRLLAPNRAFYNPLTGALDIENRGVAPDTEVELTPALWRAGRDPQLERAVQLALEQLQSHPPPRPRRPNAPIYR